MTNWPEFEGQMTKAGVNAAILPFPRLVNVVYAHLLENRDSQQRERFISELDLPIDKRDDGAGGVWARESQSENFAKAQAQFEDAFGDADADVE